MNAAFVGGGVCSVIGLGEYSVAKEKYDFTSFSGASIGAVIASCLAAGKSPEEIRNFLAENVEEFCKFVVGNFRIKIQVDDFLGGILYKDLPVECTVSITPLRFRKDFPVLITRENSEDLTVGEVVALSASLPGLFLPGKVRLEGKFSFVLDGGILFNPPLSETEENFLFTFVRTNKKTSNTKWGKRKGEQEKAVGEKILKAPTEFGTTGKMADVFSVYEEGRKFAINEIEIP